MSRIDVSDTRGTGSDPGIGRIEGIPTGRGVGVLRRWVSPFVVTALIFVACGSSEFASGSLPEPSNGASVSSGDDGLKSGNVEDSDSDSDNGGSVSGQSEDKTQADGGETRIVETIWGSVEIPANPQYILAVDEYAALNLLGLGIEPNLVIGTYQAEPPRLIIESHGIEQISGAYGEYNLEEIASRQPDLIVLVGNEESEDVYRSLAPIAPTVVIPFIAPWRDIVTFSGELTNRQDRAAAMITAIESEIGDLGAAAGESSSLSILANSPGFGPYAIAQETSISDALAQAGYTRPAPEMAPPAFGVSVPTSEERLGEHAADRMIVLGGEGPFFPADLVLDSEVFRAIPAVSEGRVFVALGDIWSGTGPFSVYWMLQDMLAIEAGNGQAGMGVASSLAERWAAFGQLAQ